MTHNLEKAYRLRAAPTAQSLEQQKRRRQQHQWNGNVQGATNDSSDYKPAIRIVDGYPVEYSCRDDPRNTENDYNETELKIINVEFDYEMSTAPGADIYGNLRSLEWSVLWNVAQSIGLHVCNFRKQDSFYNDRRRLVENYVVGLSSLGADRVDDDTGKNGNRLNDLSSWILSFSLHSHSLFQSDFCTFLSPQREGAVCTPVRGKMTAEYIGDGEIIKRYLLTHIASEMNSERVRIEKVSEVRFIGDRDDLAAAAQTRVGMDTKNSSTNLALVVGVLVGVVVLIFAFLLARGKRRRRQRNAVVEEELPTTNNHVAAVKGNQPNSPLDRAPSGETVESLQERADSAEDLSEGTGSEQDAADNNCIEPSQRNFDDATSTEKAATQVSEQANTVPPLPPISVVPVDENQKAREPVKSKTLQARRKRKKKKKQKQRVLKRVSSRNSIDEMETIREDTEDDNNSEEYEFEGSEYSTDDEDEQLLAVTVAPVVEGSTTSGAAAPSPKVSPGPAMAVTPPSPIREEPKIRRLPPPWI
jgi:hypothetical protein